MIEFTLTRTTTASAEAVFDRLTDHASYASMTPLRSSVLEREGVPAPNGVGARRRLGLVGPPMVEEVVSYERPGLFAYRLVSGLPVRDHVGTVSLTATLDGGTRVEYHVVSTPRLRIPGIGVVLGLVLKQAISGLLDGVVKAAEADAKA